MPDGDRRGFFAREPLRVGRGGFALTWCFVNVRGIYDTLDAGRRQQFATTRRCGRQN